VPAEITVRDDAPESLRFALVSEGRKQGIKPDKFRAIVCDLLRKRPDPNNWSAPNVWAEVEELIFSCGWPRVYDIMEAVYALLLDYGGTDGDESRFADAMNSAMLEDGIGWQLRSGRVEAREPAAVEQAMQAAEHALDPASFANARRELALARQALSARPIADLTGALAHMAAALESTARRYGQSRDTLGILMENQGPTLGIRPPLHIAASKIYGFASSAARHGDESQPAPTRDEVDLALGVYAALLTFLIARHESGPAP
jgi:hypothetical protein